MRLNHAEDMARFVEELKRETDQCLPIVGADMIDEKRLEEIIALKAKNSSSKRMRIPAVAGGIQFIEIQLVRTLLP